MNHFSKLFGRGAALLAALMLPLALLSCCGGSGSSDSSAKIRLVNASIAYAGGLDLVVSDSKLASNISYGNAKFRLINAVARLIAGLTMTLHYSAIATNIQPGASPTPRPVYSIAELPVFSSGVYTVFMMGSANSIAGTLRRER